MKGLVLQPVGEFQPRGIVGPKGIDLYLGLLLDRRNLLLRLSLCDYGCLPRLFGHLLIRFNLVAGHKGGLIGSGGNPRIALGRSWLCEQLDAAGRAVRKPGMSRCARIRRLGQCWC